MRIPKPVQRAEAGRGRRLVHRRVVRHLWKSGRELVGVAGELFAESRVQKRCRTRTAAMMHEPCDRLDAQRLQTLQARFGPMPPWFAIAGRDFLPQEGLAQGLESKCGKTIEIIDALVVAVEGKLIE